MDTPNNSVLSPQTLDEINHWLTKYPPEQKRSATLAALRIAQHQNHGYLTTELMDAVAVHLDLPPIFIYEVASFYSMFELKPVGRNSISVCTNISCMLRGSERIVRHLEQKLGITTGESTPDGRFYLKCEEECLAACVNAPVMQINHVYHENLTPKAIDDILDNLEEHHGQ